MTATAIGAVLFTPWASILIQNLGQAHTVTCWTEFKLPLGDVGQAWLANISYPFYDQGLIPFTGVIRVGFVILVVCAFYCLLCRAPSRVSGLIILLTVIPALPLVLPDLLMGGQRSTYPRYLIPTLLGIQLTVVYLLS